MSPFPKAQQLSGQKIPCNAKVFFYFFQAENMTEYTISVGVGVVVNFVLNYIMISLWTSVGACIATVISQVAVDYMQFRQLKNEVRFKSVVKLSYKYVFASIIMFIVCSLTKIVVSRGIASIILQVIVGVIVYGFILIRLKDEYLYMFLRKIYEKTTGRQNSRSII